MYGAVFITRPKENAEIIAERIREKGYDVFVEPFLDIIFDNFDVPDLENYQGLIFTSANGVRSFCCSCQNRALPVFVVGNNTAQITQENGFPDIKNADGTLADLEDILMDDGSGKPYLHVCGQHISRSIQSKNPDVRIDKKIGYHTEKIKQISDKCAAMLEQEKFSYILFFSKRTAENFVEVVRTQGLEDSLKRTKALCLGDSMVQCLSVLPWQEILVAGHPNQDGMLALLDETRRSIE